MPTVLAGLKRKYHSNQLQKVISTPQVKRVCFIVFLTLYDIIIVSLTTVHDPSQSYPGIPVLIHSLLCLQEKKNAQRFSTVWR